MSCFRYQVSQSAEVVSSAGKGEQPPNLVDPSQLHFPDHPHHFHPPERLLHSFSLPLTHLIPPMSRGPLVHRAPAVRIVLRHMWGNVHPAESSYESLRVVVFVSSQGEPLSAGDGLGHEHRCISLRSSISLGQKSLHQKPVTILHQYMSQVAELGFAPFGFLEQSSVGIRGRFMGLVRPFLLVKVDLSSWSGWLPLSVLPPKALLTGPSLDQGSVHGEMFIRHVRLGAFQHPLEKTLRNLFIQQALPILAVHRVIPDRFVHLHPHKPPEQHVVL